MEEHTCSQSGTLAMICTKLDAVSKDIEEMKQMQKDILEKCNTADIDRAKYPSPNVVQRYIKTVDRHDVYFYLLGSAILIILGWISGFIQKVVSLA